MEWFAVQDGKTLERTILQNERRHSIRQSIFRIATFSHTHSNQHPKSKMWLSAIVKGKTHLQTSQHSVFHHTNKFLMAQAVVSIHVKEFKYSIQNVFWQLVTGGNFYSSFKLGCEWNEKRLFFFVNEWFHVFWLSLLYHPLSSHPGQQGGWLQSPVSLKRRSPPDCWWTGRRP